MTDNEPATTTRDNLLKKWLLALEEASTLGRQLVVAGKASEVRAALDSVRPGAKVSELSGTEVFDFLKALKGVEMKTGEEQDHAEPARKAESERG